MYWKVHYKNQVRSEEQLIAEIHAVIPNISVKKARAFLNGQIAINMCKFDMRLLQNKNNILVQQLTREEALLLKESYYLHLINLKTDEMHQLYGKVRRLREKRGVFENSYHKRKSSTGDTDAELTFEMPDDKEESAA